MSIKSNVERLDKCVFELTSLIFKVRNTVDEQRRPREIRGPSYCTEYNVIDVY